MQRRRASYVGSFHPFGSRTGQRSRSSPRSRSSALSEGARTPLARLDVHVEGRQGASTTRLGTDDFRNQRETVSSDSDYFASEHSVGILGRRDRTRLIVVLLGNHVPMLLTVRVDNSHYIRGTIYSPMYLLTTVTRAVDVRVTEIVLVNPATTSELPSQSVSSSCLRHNNDLINGPLLCLVFLLSACNPILPASSRSQQQTANMTEGGSENRTAESSSSSTSSPPTSHITAKPIVGLSIPHLSSTLLSLARPRKQ